jgi:hypothetical protein
MVKNFMKIRILNPNPKLWSSIVKKGKFYYITDNDPKGHKFLTLDLGDRYEKGIQRIGFIRGVPREFNYEIGKKIDSSFYRILTKGETIEEILEKGITDFKDDFRSQAIRIEYAPLNLKEDDDPDKKIKIVFKKYKDLIIDFLSQEYQEIIKEIKIVSKEEGVFRLIFNVKQKSNLFISRIIPKTNKVDKIILFSGTYKIEKEFESEWIDGDVEVIISFGLLSDEEICYVREAESIIRGIGIWFDSAYDIRDKERIWQLDWSLENAEILIKENNSEENRFGWKIGEAKFIIDLNKLNGKEITQLHNAERTLFFKAKIPFDTAYDLERNKRIWFLESKKSVKIMIKKSDIRLESKIKSKSVAKILKFLKVHKRDLDSMEGGKYYLVNAVLEHRKNLNSFFIPSDDQIDSIKIGDFAKLIFTNRKGNNGSRLWVVIEQINDDYYVGGINNSPNHPKKLGVDYGQKIIFNKRHIINLF